MPRAGRFPTRTIWQLALVPQFGGGAAEWHAAKDDLAAAQKEIEAAVDPLTAADLVRWIENPDGTGYTVGILDYSE